MFKNHKAFLIFLCLLFSFPLFAKTYLRVTVENVPNAIVTIDGKNKGEQPVYCEVTSGSHIVQVNKTGYLEYYKVVIVPQDTTFDLVVTLQKKEGSISANANIPSAQVYLDGAYKGLTPLTIDNVSPGYHRVVFKKDSYNDINMSAYVVAGETFNVNAHFQGASLIVHSNVQGASVYLDDELLGTVGNYFDNLPPGSHTVEVYKAHYSLQSQRVSLIDGKASSVTLNLEKISGYIQVDTVPEYATIEIAGKPSTKLEPHLFEVDSGECSVTASAFGYASKTIKSKVRVDATTRESIALETVPFALLKLSTNLKSFNPNNKHVNGYLEIGWEVTAPETGVLNITDSSGKSVYYKAINFTSWTGSLRWDGKSNLRSLPAGTYYITLSCQEQSLTLSVEIDPGIKDYLQHSRGGNGSFMVFVSATGSDVFSGVNWGYGFITGGTNIYGGLEMAGVYGKYKNPSIDDQYVLWDIMALVGVSYNINSFRPFAQLDIGYCNNPIVQRGGLLLGLELGVDYANPVADKFIVGLSYTLKGYGPEGVAHGIKLNLGFDMDACCF